MPKAYKITADNPLRAGFRQKHIQTDYWMAYPEPGPRAPKKKKTAAPKKKKTAASPKKKKAAASPKKKATASPKPFDIDAGKPKWF